MKRLSRFAASLGICGALIWTVGASRSLARHAIQNAQKQASADAGVTIALTGDSIITRKLSVGSGAPFEKMIALLRGADVAFTNLEMLFHDYEPYPSTQSGGTYMRADPALAKDLVWAGFDIVSRSNNHTGDYGVEGMELTTKYVRAAGLVQAGVGESLREAREPGYLDSPKGRIALVSVASTFPDQSRAGETWGDTRPRPGLNPLRHTTTYMLTRSEFDELRTALAAAGQLRRRGAPSSSQDADEMNVLGRHFVVGEKQETRTAPLKQDLDAIAAEVSNASREADYTIVYSHTHEGGADRYAPPEFFITFAHDMIDHGADIVTASGPHVLRGIEIYKGKPIFYGLGDFIFENETLQRQPPENYEPLGLPRGSGVADFNDRRFNNGTTGFPSDEHIFESVIAIPRFEGKKLTEIRLYPLSLGFGKPRADRGAPTLADPTLARKIIDDLTKFSEPFGTHITFRDGIGVISVAQTASK